MEKRIVLIYPYFRANDPVENLFQPLGISYLASQLKALSIPVDIVDCTFEVFVDVVDRIEAMNPSIVAISIMISTSRNGFALVRALQSRLPDTLFVAGGPLPTLYPERFLTAFRAVFRGEGDVVFPDFCRAWLSSDDPERFMEQLNPDIYPGITMIRKGSLTGSLPIHNSASVLNTLPSPERRGIDHRKYQQFWMDSNGQRPATIMVTRGCPYSCDFCSKPVWGNLFRKPELDRVFVEIEEIQSLGYDQLWIADDSFTLDLDFLRTFCQEKIARGLKISWTCLSRTDGLDAETVELMKGAGCVQVYLGLESGSDHVLGLMSKRTTVQNGIDAVGMFKNSGIRTAAFFIVGYPGETVETIEATFAHALSLKLDDVFFNIPFPLPGSPLFDRVSGLDRQADWEKASEIRFVYTSEFDEEWLRQGIDRTMGAFRQQLQGVSQRVTL